MTGHPKCCFYTKLHLLLKDLFVSLNDKKYDLIIFDTFKGEDPPNHVFTEEAMNETKKILNPGGNIFVNSLGYIEGDAGKAPRSIYKTFLAAGYKVEVLPTDPDPDQRNLLFYASVEKVKPNSHFIPQTKIDLADAVVLKDEFPTLDILNATGAKRWRVQSINVFYSDPNQRALPLFE